MNGVETLKRFVPSPVQDYIRRLRKQWRSQKRADTKAQLPPFDEADFKQMLADRLHVRPGDVVFVHVGYGQMYASFSPDRLVDMLIEAVGPAGTLLFPTFPTVASLEFLQKGMVHDARTTPSGMGAVTEIARKRPGFRRTAHPVRSITGIGPRWDEIVKDQCATPLFYDDKSPFFRLSQVGGKIVGLGVGSERCSFVHTADDFLRDAFPVVPYLPDLYRAKCIDESGRELVIETYAHDMAKMNHDVPKLMRSWVDPRVGEDLVHAGRRFFRADCAPLFDKLVELAKEGKTIYDPAVYKPGRTVHAN
jgi:aminoglycoside N3'-acetyltransferase